MNILRKIKHRFLKRKAEQEKMRNFIKEYTQLKEQEINTRSRFLFNKEFFFPCLNERTTSTNFDRHYIYHPAWAMRRILEKGVKKHVDIASSLSFASMLSAQISVDFYDFRPPKLDLSGLKSSSIDLTKLHFADNSIDSLSCMHTIEHVGLGRYGDKLNYNGDLEAIKELCRVLSVKGHLYIVVPVASEAKIMFNAHRIYTKMQIVEEFEKNNLVLEEFTIIPDDEKDGGLVIAPSNDLLERQNYACGCFIFTKLRND